MIGRYAFDGVVVVPARVAMLLDHALELETFAQAVRHADAEVDSVLRSWREVALNEQARLLGSAIGTALDTLGTEVAPSTKSYTASEVAKMVGISERAVTKAAQCERITGARVAGRWTFDADAVASFIARRAA